MGNYYASKLNSQSLYQVYETQFPRIKQYFAEEINFVRKGLSGTERVLEMAAGYGRIVRELAPYCKSIVGMDISSENVTLGREYLRDHFNAAMVAMDAHEMHFDETFDVILCLQNALSAMKADSRVIQNIIQLLAPGGKVYFSTYSEKFWDWRLKWFEEQVSKGLLGEIDYQQTKDGIIVCKDGFKAITHSPEDLKAIGDLIGLPYKITEVDESSLFLVVEKK